MSDVINAAVEALSAKLPTFDAPAKFVIPGEGTIIVDQSGVRAADEEADVTLTTEAEVFRASLTPLVNGIAADLANAVLALQGQIDDSRTQSLAIDASGQLVLTRGDGTTASVDLATFLSGQVNDVLNEFWPCGPLQRVHTEADSPFTGQGTSCDPLGLDCEAMADCVADGLADLIATAPPTNEGPALPTTVYGARVALLGQPDGWLNIGGRKIPFWS